MSRLVSSVASLLIAAGYPKRHGSSRSAAGDVGVYWLKPGDEVWRSDGSESARRAAFLWDDGSLWGLSVGVPGSPSRENSAWDFPNLVRIAFTSAGAKVKVRDGRAAPRRMRPP